MSYLILGVALLAGFVLAGRWYASADPRTLIKVLKWSLIGLVVAVAGFFLLTGRLGLAIVTLPALIPWLMRARAVARMAKTFSRMSGGGMAGTGAAGGGASEVETDYLDMTLDHSSGRMTGTVTKGAFAGCRVEDLGLAELIELLAECRRVDGEAARLLEAYLERAHPDWRDAAANTGDQKKPGAAAPDMDRVEALKILGLEPGAGADDIKEAHRRLIAGLHPDHGGSDYLAAQINRAKDILLGD